ncbi:hypothetical protein K3495_g14928 [Podosphaera aphanis]|nr:hypothetical protein K3495_g14928 [Podosphaera aphanis]
MNRPQTLPPSSTSPQSHARSRARKLTKEKRIEVDEIEAFNVSSPEHRQLTYFELAYAHLSHFGVSEKIIQRATSRS